MEGIELLKETKKKAETKYQEYLEAHRDRKGRIYTELKQVYGHMRHGRALIDIVQAMRDTGLREDGWPRIAIVRADYDTSYFVKMANGGGFFTGTEEVANWRGGQGSQRYSTRKEDVALPHETFSGGEEWGSVPWRDSRARTVAPHIPPKFIPDHDFRNYYLLWEAEEWSRPVPPKDPMLLKRVNNTAFVVLSSWDLTEVERAVLNGRIG